MNNLKDPDGLDELIAAMRSDDAIARRLLENARQNEQIARNLFAVEQKILAIDNFTALFKELLLLIEDLFKLPLVWVVISEGSDLAATLEASDSSSLLSKRLKLVPRDSLTALFGDRIAPMLANQDLRRFDHLLPRTRRALIRSLALAPLTMNGHLVGSLNLADSSPDRYPPDKDTFFLTQLAVKVSICLANVTAHEKLHRLATRDPLTDLLNRREMETVLQQELTQAARYGQPLALIFLDCDDFKQVNDRYGHDCGDALLKHVADLMRKTLRTSDWLFRFAGDEFVIILPHQSQREAELAAQRVRLALRANPLSFQGNTIPVGISCGVASSADTVELTPNAFLKIADSRLYEAKAHKRTAMMSDGEIRT